MLFYLGIPAHLLFAEKINQRPICRIFTRKLAVKTYIHIVELLVQLGILVSHAQIAILQSSTDLLIKQLGNIQTLGFDARITIMQGNIDCLSRASVSITGA